MIRIALVGYGYWGPNLARCVASSPVAKLTVIIEPSPDRSAAARESFPFVDIRSDFDEVLGDPTIDAVILATPTPTHAELACLAMAHGKHVLVEKPMADSSAAAMDMVEASERYERLLMVNHTYLFSPAFAIMCRLIVERELGPVRYYHSNRSNCFGPGHETSVLWDLAVHDLSMLDCLMPVSPTGVHTAGLRAADGQPASHAQLTLTWPGLAMASVLVSWVAPAKVRQVTLGFDHHTIQWDDLAECGRVQMFDRGLEPLVDPGNQRLARSVTEIIPVPTIEPLTRVIEHFTEQLVKGSVSSSYAATGLRIIRLLEAAERSMTGDGEYIEFQVAGAA